MAINKSTTEYYNLEQAAEVLSVPAAEVNRLREQNKLRGFRDGSNWKFNKEGIHAYLAESIKARNGNAQKPDDSGFDLGGEAVDSSFDLLVEEAVLPDDSDLISVTTPKASASDLDLAALDQDSELALAEESNISAVIPNKKGYVPDLSDITVPSDVVQFDGNDESSVLALDPSDSQVVEFEEDDSVIGSKEASSQLGLAGDSGFDVLAVDGEASEVIFDIEEAQTEIPAPILDEEEFDLEPSNTTGGSVDSESSSQVIAIDLGKMEAEQNSDPFGQDPFGMADFGGFDSGIAAAAPSASTDPFGGMGGTSGGFDSNAFDKPFVSANLPKQTVEQEYSTGVLIALVSALVVMLLPSIMLLDAMVNMWSWNEPFVLNSVLMDTIAGWFGL